MNLDIPFFNHGSNSTNIALRIILAIIKHTHISNVTIFQLSLFQKQHTVRTPSSSSSSVSVDTSDRPLSKLDDLGQYPLDDFAGDGERLDWCEGLDCVLATQ
jgi:hypothetical protein